MEDEYFPHSLRALLSSTLWCILYHFLCQSLCSEKFGGGQMWRVITTHDDPRKKHMIHLRTGTQSQVMRLAAHASALMLLSWKSASSPCRAPQLAPIPRSCRPAAPAAYTVACAPCSSNESAAQRRSHSIYGSRKW